MANNEDVNQANQGAPAADIPDLKKKEKERKKAGAGWGGAKPGGGGFSGATGGTVARAAASAAGIGGEAAIAGAAESAGAGWLSSMIANLTATVLGKALLAAGVAAFLLGAGVLGYAMLHGGVAGNGGTGDLGAIASSMKVHTEGGDRLGVASNGEIMFDPLKKAEAKKEEKAPDDKTAGDKVPPAAENPTADAAKGDWNRPGLDHNLSGTKLSSSLGGGFGGKNIFAGSSGAPKLNEGLSKVNIQGGQKGRLSASTSKATGRVVKGGKGQQIKSNKAFGQLKIAKGNSALGAGTSAAEGARAAAANAFDGGPAAGNVVGGPTAPTGNVDTPSGVGGAPDVTAPTVDDPCAGTSGANCVPTDQNTAGMLAGIAAMAKQAGEMKKKAAELMIVGLALVVAGIALMCSGWPWCIAIGAIVLAIGAMIIGMSIMMGQMADMMKGMADSMSQGLAASTGDVKQDQINKYCIDKAYREGTDPKNCNPPDSVTDNVQTTKDDAAAVKEHKDMVKETSQVDLNGSPTAP
jgi:hypothetical protein